MIDFIQNSTLLFSLQLDLDKIRIFAWFCYTCFPQNWYNVYKKSF